MPGVDLDSVLGSFNDEVQDQEPSFQSGSNGPQQAKETKATPGPKPSGPGRTVESGVESLPREADGFDWAEHEVTLGGLSDGMAALSINPDGAGYLGAFLRFSKTTITN